MNFKVTSICSAVLFALNTPVVLAQESNTPVDETIVVHAQSFNDYKVDSATGAMRTDTSMLDTAQSINVIPEIVLDEPFESHRSHKT